MKLFVILGTLLLACTSMVAQSTTPPPSGKPTDMPPGMKMESAQKSHDMSDMKSHMEEMKTEMEQMKTRTEKMRTDAEKVQDPNTKAALLDNADMWDHFMSQMQSHMDMMMNGGGMHHEGMMSEKKGTTHGTMHGKTPKAPKAGEKSDTTPK